MEMLIKKKETAVDDDTHQDHEYLNQLRAVYTQKQDDFMQQSLQNEYERAPNKADDQRNPQIGEAVMTTLSPDPAPEDDYVQPPALFGDDAEQTVQVIGDTEEAYRDRLRAYDSELEIAIGNALNESEKETLRNLLKSDLAKSVFTYRKWTGVDIDPIRIPFDNPPAYLKGRARPIPIEIEKEAIASIEKFVKSGYLIKADKGNYGSALQAVWKPDGTARICGDYRLINKHIPNMPVLMPDIKASIDRLRLAKYLAEFDWTTAFHQLPIDELTQERLAITTPWGIYRPQFVPEGCTPGSALLMSYAKEIFKEYSEWLIPVHDNILIGADTPQQLIERTQLLLEKCRRHKVQLKIKKSKIGVKAIKFFGFILDVEAKSTVAIEKERIEGIQNIAFPTTRKQIQQFVGMLTFISPFIPGYAHKMHQLMKMLHTDFSFHERDWNGVNYKEIWEQAKTEAAKTVELYLPDRALAWTLRTDASAYGVGGYLTQSMPIAGLRQEDRERAIEAKLVDQFDRVEVPIAFTSKIFSTQAQKWSTTEQELFALVHAFKKLERLLIYKPIQVMTDHANLVTLQFGALADTAKATRWRQWLAQFPFYVRHIPGHLNITADFLSRHPMTTENKTTLASVTHIMATAEKALRTADQTEGEVKNELLHAIMQWSESIPIDDSHIHEIRLNAIESIQDAIRRVHDRKGGHRGALATWRNVNQAYPGCKISYTAVQDAVAECPTCQKLRAPKQMLETLNKALPVYHPRAVCHVDVLQLETDKYNNKNAFVFVNAVTKYVYIYPAPSKEPKHFAKAVLQLMATIGITDIFWGDGGTEFTAGASKLLVQYLGADLTFTIAERPQANGIVERVNQEILKEIQLLMTDDSLWKMWSDPTVISLVQMYLNTREHSATGYTPVELTFGTMAKLYQRDPLIMTPIKSRELQEFNDTLKSVQDAAIWSIQATQKQRIDRLNKKVKQVTYTKGMLVLHNPMTNSTTQLRVRKLQPARLGPYRVIETKPSTDGTDSNTIRCKYINEDKEVEFHHSTLTIFTGTEQEARELQRIDNYEYDVEAIVDMRGNTFTRTDMQFLTKFKDKSEEWLSWEIVKKTEQLDIFLKNFTFTELLQERKGIYEDAFWIKNKGTVKSMVHLFQDADRPTIGATRYISIAYWHTSDWHSSLESGILPTLHPKYISGAEAHFKAFISQISDKRIEITIPDLQHLTTMKARSGQPKKTKISPYRKDLSIPRYLHCTTHKEPEYPYGYTLNESQLARCTIRDLLHTAAGWPKSAKMSECN